MKRDLTSLGASHYDLLVVGGGILGSAASWEAARRGLRVALVEQGDFGHATSANSLKIIHGGFRYLQHAQFGRMRDSIRARRAFLRLAPHLVRPLPCLVPTYGCGLRSRGVMAAALAANALISCDRNAGVSEDRHLPAGGLLSLAECRRVLPNLARNDLTGAAWWCDAIADNTERLTLSFVLSAAARGATVANYIRAARLLTDKGRVAGVEAVDQLTGKSFEVRADNVVLSTGPWRDLQPPSAGQRGWLRAFNIVVRKKWFDRYAVALEIRDKATAAKRNLFFAPWRDGTMIGTSYARFDGSPDASVLREEEIGEFIRDLNAAWPTAGLTVDDVTFAHVGVLPASITGTNEPEDTSRLIDHGRAGGPRGLITALGVKYTTGLVEGIRVADLVTSRPAEGSSSLEGGEARISEEDIRREDPSLAEDIVKNLLQYGTGFRAVLACAPKESAATARVVPDRPVLRAEVIAAVRNEMALHLADVVLRRTTLGSFDFPGVPALQVCASLMARELGWDGRREAEEIAAVRKLYYTPDPN